MPSKLRFYHGLNVAIDCFEKLSVKPGQIIAKVAINERKTGHVFCGLRRLHMKCTNMEKVTSEVWDAVMSCHCHADLNRTTAFKGLGALWTISVILLCKNKLEAANDVKIVLAKDIMSCQISFYRNDIEEAIRQECGDDEYRLKHVHYIICPVAPPKLF